METFNSKLIHTFLTRQSELTDRVVMSFFRAGIPHETERFDRCIRDVNAHISTLANALAAGEAPLFIDYVNAVTGAMVARNVPAHYMRSLLEIVARCLPEVLPENVAGPACELIQQALAEPAQVGEPPSFIDPSNPLADAARQYLDHLIAGDSEAAASIAWRAVRGGIGLSDVLLGILQTCQREVGRLWQLNRITIAREHYCTACTRLVMSQLMTASPRRGSGRTIVATCVEGELHDLGLAMVGHLLEMSGWNVHYLGADLPPEEIIGALEGQHAQLLAVSVTLTRYLQWASAIIDLVRTATTTRHVPIMVGGWPFVITPDLADKIGADGSAPDGQAAAETAAHLAVMMV